MTSPVSSEYAHSLPPSRDMWKLIRAPLGFRVPDIPVKCLAILLMSYLPQLVLYLRLVAMLALMYIHLKKYTSIECILTSYFPIRAHNETNLAITGLILGISNWSTSTGSEVWVLSTGPGIP